MNWWIILGCLAGALIYWVFMSWIMAQAICGSAGLVSQESRRQGDSNDGT